MKNLKKESYNFATCQKQSKKITPTYLEDADCDMASACAVCHLQGFWGTCVGRGAFGCAGPDCYQR